MINLRRFVCYLSRVPRTYGFGVQSPFAYRFIRDIVVGHSFESVFSHSSYLSPSLSYGSYSADLVSQPVCKKQITSLKNQGYTCLFSSDNGESIFSSLSKRHRRIYQFIYRLCIFSSANNCFVTSDFENTVLTEILGSMNCRIVPYISTSDKIKFSVISPNFIEYDTLLDHMAANGVLVVYGIRLDRKGLDYWKQLVSDCRTFVSFDLYDLGVIFFDSKMHKRNYCCNIG